ncbi:MAG: GNAT family N-acetyltransferase [Gammaproteobacteria bacterium]|nr:GNAT family N-acetyltransferase [Gammaproteobacteria bacterium]
MTHIRAATRSDVGLIHALIRELAEFEKLSGEVGATEELLKESLFGPDAVAEAIIAEDAGQSAGFALYFHSYSTFLARPGIYLEDLYVRPEFRGRGIGRALLAHVARTARERRCGRLEWSVLDWNKPAIGFYRSLGAVAMDEWTTFRLSGAGLEALADQARRAG